MALYPGTRKQIVVAAASPQCKTGKLLDVYVASITVMEIVDNALMLVIPGAMDAPLTSLLFWGSLALALGVAGIAAFPVNRWLIARGGGHAVVLGHH